MEKRRAGIIGSGFSGLSAACFLAEAGFDVTVLEKNASPGGRARKFQAAGFSFDMGPSWYWMPDVFESFFQHFGKRVADFYHLVRLDPSYRVVFGEDDWLDIPAGVDALCTLFDTLEPGSGASLKKFLHESQVKYELSMRDLVYKPGVSVFEFLEARVLKGILQLHLFESISSHIEKHFKSKKLIRLLEFPVLFLGATPQRTSALYSLMNYADMALGTWYPLGGMHKIVEGMVALAASMGVKFSFNHTVEHVTMNTTKARGLVVDGSFQPYDYLVASADYHHVEQRLLPAPYRRYSEKYWEKRVMAPSCLIFYLGVRGKVDRLQHHTLFFDEDYGQHAAQIYEHPQWPSAPQFYVGCPSKTDPSVAPEGCENLFVLIPVAPGLTDSEATREHYFSIVMARLEKFTRQRIGDRIVFRKSYAHNDFIHDYNAYKGNAYGLANTLRQTALLKPSIVNPKVSNLFYAGQLTVPGPGVPPAIISGQVAAQALIRKHQEFVN